MIIDLHEKYDVSPEWFEEQAKSDPQQAWKERLCMLLSAYMVKGKTGAEKAAEKMIAAGIDEDMIRVAMD